MKKFCINLLALLAISLGTQAQTLSVADAEALSSGETIKFNLHATDIVAMTSTHFEVNVPSPLSVTKVEKTEDWSGASFSREGGVIGGISSSDDAFNGEGDIATVSVTVPEGTATGIYHVTIDNIRINGVDYGSPVEFNIAVVTSHLVLLDENAESLPETQSGVNVKVQRTLKAGVWSTICLPFAMTEEQTKAAFGEDVELADFEGITSNYDTDEETILSIQVNFSQATSIEINHPYLIKVDNNISSFTVDNVDVAPDNASVDKDEWRSGSGTKKDPYVYHYNSFVGTYVANTQVPDLCLFLNGGKFWYSTGNTVMKAFRAYFDFYDVLTEVEESSSSAPSIILSFDGKGGDVTKIDGRTMEQIETGRVYNIAGQYVGESENINQLPKGIYIVNGKKKVIK